MKLSGSLILFLSLIGCSSPKLSPKDFSAEEMTIACDKFISESITLQSRIVECADNLETERLVLKERDYELWMCENPDQERKCSAFCKNKLMNPVNYTQCYWLCVGDKPEKPKAN